MMGNIFDKYRSGLKKTQTGLVSRLLHAINAKSDDGLLDEIEEIMLSADMGYPTVSRVMSDVRGSSARGASLEVLFKDSLYNMLKDRDRGIKLQDGLNIILFVGVNGVGKTTTIAKVAAEFDGGGKKVLIAAGDTYRAAGGDQMKIWGDRLGIRVIGAERGSDPSSVVYDSIDAALSGSYDVLLVDTAGRLHNNRGLMTELDKIVRTIIKKTGSSPRETLLVVDANTGQNALRQTEMFNQTVTLTGIVVTKMDGSAKGGVIFPMELESGLPVKYIGLGEASDDLQPFDPVLFIQALFEVS